MLFFAVVMLMTTNPFAEDIDCAASMGTMLVLVKKPKPSEPLSRNSKAGSYAVPVNAFEVVRVIKGEHPMLKPGARIRVYSADDETLAVDGVLLHTQHLNVDREPPCPSPSIAAGDKDPTGILSLLRYDEDAKAFFTQLPAWRIHASLESDLLKSGRGALIAPDVR